MDLVASEMYKDNSDDEDDNDNDDDERTGIMASDFFGSKSGFKSKKTANRGTKSTREHTSNEKKKSGVKSKRTVNADGDEYSDEDEEEDDDAIFDDVDAHDDFDDMENQDEEGDEPEEHDDDDDDDDDLQEDDVDADADADEFEEEDGVDGVDNTLPLSSYQKRKLKLQAEQEALEEGLIAEKNWDMRGEVKSADRPENSLLEMNADIERYVVKFHAV